MGVAVRAFNSSYQTLSGKIKSSLASSNFLFDLFSCHGPLELGMYGDSFRLTHDQTIDSS